MRKSTAAISLVMIGSTFLFGGCSSQKAGVAGREDEEGGARASNGGHAGFAHVGRVAVGRGATGASVGASARGGFGGFGAASASS